MCDMAPNGTSREPAVDAVRCSDQRVCVERVTRIELAFSAWEADVLPLNYTRRTGLDHLAAPVGSAL
jgi:hypothetical protein